MVNAIRTVYNISLPLALFLTIAGFLFCGRYGIAAIPLVQTINLKTIARHSRIEHDGSLAHADAEPGAEFAPTTPDKAILTDLLKEAGGRQSLNLGDLVRVRARRDEALRVAGKKLGLVHCECAYTHFYYAVSRFVRLCAADITLGECAFILGIMGNGEEVPVERIRQWMGEDRLPDGWNRPKRTLGLLELRGMVMKISNAVKMEKTRMAAHEKGK